MYQSASIHAPRKDSTSRGRVAFGSTPPSTTDRERPSRLGHGLANHPLLTLNSIGGLAAVLPPEQMTWHRGRLEINDNPREAIGNDLTALETVLGIETCDSWIALRHVGVAPAFAPLVDALIAELAPALRSRGIKMLQPRCDLYLSSPHAVTPCHIEQQNSFHLQIQGSKRVSVFDGEDREVMTQERLEFLSAKRHRSFKINRRYMDRAQSQPLTPGAGLYLPARTPLYIRNGGAVSITASLTFGTKETNTERAVLSMNHRLRSIGFAPRTPGASRAIDSLKAVTFRGLGGTRRVLRRRPSR